MTQDCPDKRTGKRFREVADKYYYISHNEISSVIPSYNYYAGREHLVLGLKVLNHPISANNMFLHRSFLSIQSV